MPSIIVLKSYRIRFLNRDNNFPTIGSNPTTWLRSQQVILFSKPIRETLLSNTFIFESTTLVSYVLTWFFLLYIDSLASLMYFQAWFNVIGCWQQLSSFISASCWTFKGALLKNSLVFSLGYWVGWFYQVKLTSTCVRSKI